MLLSCLQAVIDLTQPLDYEGKKTIHVLKIATKCLGLNFKHIQRISCNYWYRVFKCRIIGKKLIVRVIFVNCLDDVCPFMCHDSCTP